MSKKGALPFLLFLAIAAGALLMLAFMYAAATPILQDTENERARHEMAMAYRGIAYCGEAHELFDIDATREEFPLNSLEPIEGTSEMEEYIMNDDDCIYVWFPNPPEDKFACCKNNQLIRGPSKKTSNDGAIVGLHSIIIN
jgi:hypothetical protein